MIALVTAASAAELDTDLPLLHDEMPDAVVAVWSDPGVDWSSFDAVIIRSAWDYHERRDEFLDWARGVESVTALWNPVELLEWNTDKRYLLDLARHDIPIVPSMFVEPGTSWSGLVSVGGPIDFDGDIVVKPTVGAGSRGVERFTGDASGAHAAVEAWNDAGRTAMVQPYQSGVDEHGETGLVYVGGEFSHAFRKWAILDAPIVWDADGLFARERTGGRTASAGEADLGDRVMATLPRTAYVRIDLLPGLDGPVVLEVELTEPSLFLDLDPGAPARAAAAFRNLAT